MKSVTIEMAKLEHLNNIVSFQLAMAKETEDQILDKAILTKGVRAVFEKPNLAQYYVAINEGQVIASTMITYEWSDWRNSTVWWIQSVYVLPEFRGQKVFKKMYEYLQSQVKNSDNIGGLRLYVDKRNQNAQGVYETLGMNGEHYSLFEWMK